MPITLIDSLAASVARAPDRMCFAFEGHAATFREFQAQARAVANALAASGIRPGERIAYIGKNADRYFQLLYGAMWAGVVVAPVNWRLAGPEIAVIVDDAEARLIVVGPEFHGLIAQIRPQIPRVSEILALEGGHDSWQAFDDWRDAAPPVRVPYVPAPDDVAVQLYTSGTTGRPKGVMLMHRNFTHALDSNAAAGLSWNEWREGDIAIQAMPVSHIGGTGWGIITVHNAASCHIQRQFDIDQTFDMIELGANNMFLVPAAMQFLVRHPRAARTDFSRFRQIGYGASPIPLPLLRECIEVLRCGFVQYYGMTETTGTIVTLPPEDHSPEGTPRMRGAGKPLPWVEMKVVDPTGAEVPRGAVGEIVTCSGANMKGYWNRPEETAKTIRDGWLHTGDAGYMDADGYVYIHDRIKDMIVSGAENVYPAEVESALAAHPAIAEVAVIGVPDETWGEAVKACVVLRPGAEATEAEIVSWARERIAGFKCPRTIDFVESLPRNASGKLLKRELRAPYWEGRTRQVN